MNYGTRMPSLLGRSIPGGIPDPITFGEEFVKFPSSARSKSFRVDVTPWNRRPLLDAHKPEVRTQTYVKPVQSGGSAFGEVMLLFWIQYGRGFLQYNWSNDKRAAERWESRIEGILKACRPVADRIAMMPKNEFTKGEIDFGNVFFRMQGAFVPDNLDSDSVPLQINEEVHAWEPGHLKKARNRSTAVWNFKSIDISNAGKKGDQLSQAFDDGTQRYWMVKCPGCGLFHEMRTRWEDRRPDLGGLRYDADKARRADSTYDYNIIKGTIRFQMPCGYIVQNDPAERRALSESGDYSDPRNSGSDGTHESYTYEAVSVDYIDWLQLIKDKHDALRALRLGDPEPWRRYRTERECLFYDPDENPISGAPIVLNTQEKKNREGLPTTDKLRLFNLDRQQGQRHRGEFPYWWITIRDYALDPKHKIKSLLVYEGRLETDEQVIQVLGEHGCNMCHGVADSGDDTEHVYLFCLQHGINAIKGGKENLYAHKNGALRIYSPERPLHTFINRPPKYPYLLTNNGRVPDPREPLYWLYSKAGIRERLAWMRSETLFETPGDVSEDYQKHMDSEERVSRKHPRTGEIINEWIQHRTRNDLFVCECYGAMQVDMAGWIGGQPQTTATVKENEPTGTTEANTGGDNPGPAIGTGFTRGDNHGA